MLELLSVPSTWGPSHVQGRGVQCTVLKGKREEKEVLLLWMSTALSSLQ